MTKGIKAGDFTGLARDYSSHRPDYSRSVLKAIRGLLPKPIDQIDAVDVGAGTGIWTRMIESSGIRSCIAIEPNLDMRLLGISDSKDRNILWKEGAAEKIDLVDHSVDWLTMASSFHWTNFELATREFHRVLRPEGLFTAVWNPRLIEVSPLLVQIENKISELNPNVKRVSSGRSEFTDSLTERLSSSPYFNDVVYIEGRHVIEMSTERYMGAWRSVNDLRVQLGANKFLLFLDYVEDTIKNLKTIEATYLTRSWTARRRG